MPFTFRFKKEKISETEYALRPKIPITLSSGRKSKEIIAILDTGSDVIYIPQEMAEYFDLELSKDKQVCQGADTEFQYRTSKIEIEVKKAHESFKNWFDVIIPYQNPLHKDVILGTPFLMNFKITFDYRKGLIIMKKSESKFDFKRLKFR